MIVICVLAEVQNYKYLVPMTRKNIHPLLIKMLLAALVLLTILAIAVARAPYMHDFAEWVYQGQIIMRFMVDPAAVSGFTLANYPVPNSLASTILAGLSFIFAPLWAGKAFLTLMLLGWYVVIGLFTRRFVDASWRASASLVLYVTTALATFFWYGFVSYQLALLLLTWFFAVYRNDTKTLVVAAFGVAIFLSHAIIFLVFGLVVGVRLLLKWNWSVFTGLMPATFLSLWFLAGRYIANVEPQQIDAAWSGLREALIYKAGYPAMLGPFKNFLLPDGTSVLEHHGWLYWPGFFINFGVAATFGLLILVVLGKYLKKELPDNQEAALLQNTWAISIVLIILFYVFAPYHFFGVVNAGGRVIIPMLLMSFMLGGNVVRPFVRLMVWPVVLIALLTSGSYAGLMLQTRQPEFSPLSKSAVRIGPSDSVLDFNQRLYAATRYKYFNYRVFAFARRFEQIESEQFHGLTFRHAMLIKYQPQSD